MNFYTQEQGKKFLAELLAGSGKHINGMYVECAPADAAGQRDAAYFERLKAVKNANYARIAISNAYADDANVVHFDALVRKEDFIKKCRNNSALACATLVHMVDDNPANDIFIVTTGFESGAVITGSSYTVVNTSIKLSD